MQKYGQADQKGVVLNTYSIQEGKKENHRTKQVASKDWKNPSIVDIELKWYSWTDLSPCQNWQLNGEKH